MSTPAAVHSMENLVCSRKGSSTFKNSHRSNFKCALNKSRAVTTTLYVWQTLAKFTLGVDPYIRKLQRQIMDLKNQSQDWFRVCNMYRSLKSHAVISIVWPWISMEQCTHGAVAAKATTRGSVATESMKISIHPKSWLTCNTKPWSKYQRAVSIRWRFVMITSCMLGALALMVSWVEATSNHAANQDS